MNLEELKKTLARYSDEDFNSYIPKTMLKLSDSEIKTIQFAFWFCYAVEKDLDSVLQFAFKQMEEIEGKTPKELLDFIRDKYEIKFEIVDPTNPKYDPDHIYFNDRIDIAEKLFGENNHTKFLRKIKIIRNDLSHGRIDNLVYDEQSLFVKETKEKMIFDYIEQMINTGENEFTGGVVDKLTKEQQKIINEKYQNWLNKK